jgi:hypothetical protein
MQTNLNEKSTFFERIMYVSQIQGFKNVTEFAKNGLDYNSPQKILRLKEGENKPSIDIILDISNKFENVNISWLMTGKGAPLTDEKKYDDQLNDKINSVFREPGVEYNVKGSTDKDRLIETQEKLIKALEEQLRLTKMALAAAQNVRKAG